MKKEKRKRAAAQGDGNCAASACGARTSKDKKRQKGECGMDIQEIGQAMARQEEQIKGLANRMDKLEKLTESVNKLAISIERLTNQQATTETQITTLTKDVTDLKEKPGKRWDLVITALITAIISAGVTLLIKG